VDAGYTIGSTTTLTQIVGYGYGTFGGYAVLTAANYSHGTGAVYYYQASNVAPGTGYPLIAACNDVRYPGPMKAIAYDFVPNGFYGQFQAERYWVGSTYPVVVSYNLATHTETRGDGATRTFVYGASPAPPSGFSVPMPYLLANFTDFEGNKTYLGYDAKGYLNKVKDARGNITSFSRASKTGNLLTLTHPPDELGVPSTIQYFYTDQTTAYYLDHVIDELNRRTDYNPGGANMTIPRIDYPDEGYETFTYNGFNQVLSHRKTSGGTETFTYDSRGLLRTYTPPATPSDPNPAIHPTIFTYNVNDHLSTIKNPRAYTTTLQHNQRGQRTEVQHHDQSKKMWDYNDDGTLKSFNNELNQSTTFTYDNFKRLRTATTPLRAPGDTTPRTTNFYYHLVGSALDDYRHTDSQVRRIIAPSGTVTTILYDDNFRKTSVTEGAGSADAATTSFAYDQVGNLVKVTEPNGQPGQIYAGADWEYTHDKRNRRLTAKDPFDKITSWDYDLVGNLKKEIRPDTKFRTWDTYDAMNRIKSTTGFLGEGTAFYYDLAGNLTRFTDDKGANYQFAYDTLNRKTKTTYTLDAYNEYRSEEWLYDAAGNLYQYTTPYGWIKTFTYDNRNRATNANWDTSYGQDVTITYDAASQVKTIVSGPTTVAFGYDNAGNKIWEDQTVSGLPTRRVNTVPDSDSNRDSLTVTTGATTNYGLSYDYTQRQQLAHIKTTSGSEMFEFTHDRSGNLKKRQNTYQGLNATNFDYDKLNRVTLCEQTGQNDVPFATNHYSYDLNNNLQYTYREEQADKGERFEYDFSNQIKTVYYNANNPQNSPPSGFDRSVTYNYSADGLNRTSVNDNGVTTSYTPNWLNQYTTVGAQALVHNGNFHLYSFNGWTYVYDADARLTSATATGQSAGFVYDGLGRCVKRTINGAVTLITYDGWQPIVEWDSAGNRKAFNIYGPGADEILSRYDVGLDYIHYHSDHMGNVQFLLNRTNVGIEKYTYDVFGKPKITDWNGNVRTQSAYGNRFMFTGREYLSTLGIYDYRTRAYHPGLGRFLQTDPIGFAAGDINLFRYVGNNPVNYTDPFGLDEGRVVVTGAPIPQNKRDKVGSVPPGGGFGGGGHHGGREMGVDTQIFIDGKDRTKNPGNVTVHPTNTPGTGQTNTAHIVFTPVPPGFNSGWMSRPSGTSPAGVDSGDAFYDFARLERQLDRYTNEHASEAGSTVQFADTVDIVVGTYAVVGFSGIAAAEALTAQALADAAHQFTARAAFWRAFFQSVAQDRGPKPPIPRPPSDRPPYHEGPY
jgi:RHS repeat-associated protein